MTAIACEMLASGKVDAVVCVQSDPDDRFAPRPVSERQSDRQSDRPVESALRITNSAH